MSDDKIEEILEAVKNNDIFTISKNLRTIFNLIKSPVKEERDTGWKIIESLIENNRIVLTDKDKRFLKSLMWNKLQGIRDDAWSHLYIYKVLGITGFDGLLTAKSDKIKWSVWSHVLDIIQLSLIDVKTVQKYSDSYWRLLKSYYPTIRKKAWRLFPKLVMFGIFNLKENSKQKERYYEFLKQNKYSVRIYAWEASIELLKNGIIIKSEIAPLINYLEELTKVKGQLGKRAKKVLNYIQNLP